MSVVIEKTFTLSGYKVTAKYWNRAKAQCVIALHGWLDNAASFDLLAPLLPECNILALDLVGHGRSDHKPLGSHYYLADNVIDVMEVADAMGWQQFTLLGHSMGAAVAGLVAAALPDRVEQLILIDGLGPLSSPPEKAGHLLKESVKQHIAHSSKKMPRYASIEAAVQARAEGLNKLTLPAARLLCERGLIVFPNGEYTWSTDPRLRHTSAMRFTEPQVLNLLSEVECRCLLVQAQDSIFNDFSEMGFAQRAQQLKNATHHIAPGGHHLHVEAEHVDKVAELILDWLK